MFLEISYVWFVESGIISWIGYSGYEVDAIVQKLNGDYAAFEIKLGVGFINEAAENLKKFAANIDTQKMESPKSLNIITGTGMSYRRPDGINIISLASLGVWHLLKEV